jgi:hypothetical protein
LGDGEGELPLVEEASSSADGRCGGVAPDRLAARHVCSQALIMGRPRVLISHEPPAAAVPIAGYFAVVGSTLTVLLLIAGLTLPKPQDPFLDRPEIVDRAHIRIESARKWPERVVFDTSQPTISPPSIEKELSPQLVERLPDEMIDRTSVEFLASSMAKPKRDARRIVAYHPPMRAKRKRARAVRSTRVGRGRSFNKPQRLSERCCWFEPTDRRVTSKVALRNRVARGDSWLGWRYPE